MDVMLVRGQLVADVEEQGEAIPAIDARVIPPGNTGNYRRAEKLPIPFLTRIGRTTTIPLAHSCQESRCSIIRLFILPRQVILRLERF